MEKEVTAVSLRQTYSAEVWKARVAACRSSGLSVKSWCAENAISTQTYYRWERKLLSEAGKQREPAENGRFAELPSTSSSETNSAVAVIRVGGMACEIRGGISEKILSQLVQAMSEHTPYTVSIWARFVTVPTRLSSASRMSPAALSNRRIA